MAGIDNEATPPVAEASALDEEAHSPEAATPGGAPAGPEQMQSSPAGVEAAGPPMPLGRRLWTASLAAALLITSAGIGILYLDDTNSQEVNHALTNQNASLRGQNDALQTDLATTKNNLTESQTALSAAQAELMHPHLGIWNVPQSLANPSEELVAGIPDTFTYHLKLTSNAPMKVSILTWHQFGDAIYCIKTGRGNTDYCMHHSGAAVGFLDVTSVSYDFHLAEGCAAYVTVITAAGAVTVTPDVSVTYNPAAHATGTCA